MTIEVTMDQLMSMCRANISVAFLLDEDAYITKLLSDYLTNEQLSFIKAQEEFLDLVHTVLVKIIEERMQDASSNYLLIVEDDAETLATMIHQCTTEEMGSTTDAKAVQAFLSKVMRRYVTLLVEYCALVHRNQRAALTRLTMATSIFALKHKVSIDEAVENPAIRAEILADLVKREAWLDRVMPSLRGTGWKTVDEGVRAGITAAIQRREREIWG